MYSSPPPRSPGCGATWKGRSPAGARHPPAQSSPATRRRSSVAPWVAAAWRLGDREAALAALRQALERAAPEGALRAFLGEGEALREPPAEGNGAAGEHPPPPLTAREREVLELLAAGYSNRQIAERLFVSLATVKKHVGNLLEKLGAANRTRAVALARRHGLL